MGWSGLSEFSSSMTQRKQLIVDLWPWMTLKVSSTYLNYHQNHSCWIWTQSFPQVSLWLLMVLKVKFNLFRMLLGSFLSNLAQMEHFGNLSWPLTSDDTESKCWTIPVKFDPNLNILKTWPQVDLHLESKFNLFTMFIYLEFLFSHNFEF